MTKGLRFGLGSGLIFGVLAAARAEPLSLVTNHGVVLACADCDVPGMPAGTTFGSSMSQPMLAEDGTVLFLSNLAGSTITAANNRALFQGTTFADLSVVARWSDPSPGLPGLRLLNNANNSAFGSNGLRFSPDGRILFPSRLTNSTNNLPTTNDTGLFGGFAGSLVLVAREGNPAPATAGAHFGDLINLSTQFTAINRNGRVLFQAPLVGGDVVGSTNDIAMYTGTPGALTIAVRKGDTMLPGPVKAAAFSGNNLMTNDRILYNLQLSGTGVTTANDESLWLYTPGSGNALLLREGNPAPGTNGAVFRGAFGMSSNGVTGNGRLEFLTSLAGGDVTAANDQALYIADTTGASTLLAREGAPAPGTNATFKGFNQFFSYVNEAGVGVFQATLTGGTVDPANDNGIWAGTPGSLSLVVRAGITPIPGAPNGSTCEAVQGHFMAFSAYGFILSCDLAGPNVFTGRNSQALVAWTPTKGLFLVWRQGQDLEIAPGVSRLQTSTGSVQFGNTDGAALGLSNTGTLGMNVYLDPGVSTATVDLNCYPTTDYYLDADGDGHGNPTTEINLCAGGVPPPGHITTAGDCLDSNPSAQGASTEVCNGIDDDCDARIDDGIPQPTGLLTMKMSKFGGSSVLSWVAVPHATTYDAIFGSLQELRSTGGYQFLSQALCWADDFVGTSMSMPGNPSPGQGQFWLMRATGCTGLGSYDEGVPSQVSARNQEIGASQYQCP
jgi:hypothetical protein